MTLSSERVRVAVTSFESVLEAARKGDGWAFDELFRSWNGRLTAFVRTRGVGDVDGVVNDVFLKAFAALGSFVGDENAFRAWIFRIARNRVIDEYRKQSRTLQTTELDVAASIAGGDVTADFEQRLGGDRVVTLLAMLTDEQREVLALRFVADLTILQIAEVTGRRQGAVKQLQRRGLRQLEKHLQSGVS